MERLSPQANGLEYVEGRELAAADVGEAIPQYTFDAATLVLRQAHGLHNAGRFGAAVPGDHDGASWTDDAVQLVHRGVEVGPDRHISHRDHTVDAGGGKTGAVGRAQLEPNPARAHGSPVVS